MNRKLAILQSEMEQCQNELRFLGADTSLDSDRFYMTGHGSQAIPVTFALEEFEKDWDKIRTMPAFVEWVQVTSKSYELNGILIQR